MGSVGGGVAWIRLLLLLLLLALLLLVLVLLGLDEPSSEINKLRLDGLSFPSFLPKIKPLRVAEFCGVRAADDDEDGGENIV